MADVPSETTAGSDPAAGNVPAAAQIGSPPASTDPPAAAGSSELLGTAVAGDQMSKRRRATFRREILKRLPQLTHEPWQVGDETAVGEELGNLVDLGADAVLAPLEALIERDR